MTRPFITSRWYRQAQAAHDAELAKPQRFPLTGDGEHAEKITTPAVWTGREAEPRLRRDRRVAAEPAQHAISQDGHQDPRIEREAGSGDRNQGHQVRAIDPRQRND